MPPARKLTGPRKQHPFGDPPPGVTHQYEGVRINGRIVSESQPLKLKGRRGNHTFIRLVTSASGKQWIDVFSPEGAFVAVHPDAVQTVRRTTTDRARR